MGLDLDLFLILLLPICMMVILPISIVLIVSLSNKAKYNKKIAFFEKCVENGVEITPELMIDKNKKNLSPRATLKTMLLNRLNAGIIVLLIGIGFIIWHCFNHLNNAMITGAIVLIAVGIGLIVWYIAGKKMLAEDIRDEAETPSSPENAPKAE